MDTIYIARKYLLLNGVKYKPGEVIPEAERLRSFRALISAGYIAKTTKATEQPPPSPPADSSDAPAKEAETESSGASVEEAEIDGVELQRESVEQFSGRSEVRDRGHKRSGPAPAGRGDTVRVVTVSK